VSGDGAPDLSVPDAHDVRVAVAAARWHGELVDGLVGGALAAAKQAGAPEPAVVRVPGALELPVVAAQLLADLDAVVVLGVVVRGETAHFDHVCRVVADGCARVSLDSGKPVGHGVLMCDTLEQARDRAGLPGSREDKGREATVAALTTALLLRELRHRGRRSTGF
jgi:6,7-dimethyl-8-ribityllumazine synthase